MKVEYYEEERDKDHYFWRYYFDNIKGEVKLLSNNYNVECSKLDNGLKTSDYMTSYTSADNETKVTYEERQQEHRKRRRNDSLADRRDSNIHNLKNASLRKIFCAVIRPTSSNNREWLLRKLIKADDDSIKRGNGSILDRWLNGSTKNNTTTVDDFSAYNQDGLMLLTDVAEELRLASLKSKSNDCNTCDKKGDNNLFVKNDQIERNFLARGNEYIVKEEDFKISDTKKCTILGNPWSVLLSSIYRMRVEPISNSVLYSEGLIENDDGLSVRFINHKRNAYT